MAHNVLAVQICLFTLPPRVLHTPYAVKKCLTHPTQPLRVKKCNVPALCACIGVTAWWRQDSQTVQVIVRLPEDASFKRDVSVDLSRRRIDLAVLGESRGERWRSQLLQGVLSIQVRRYWNRTLSILALEFRF